MAFLDNSGDIILDAVLTDTGRYRLARGDGTFRIMKFALGDDEINYHLYRNDNHPDGAASSPAHYALEILQTPVLEAFTNNTSLLKSRLISIPRTNLLYLPVLRLNTDANVALPLNDTPAEAKDMFIVSVDADTTAAIGPEGTNALGWMCGHNVNEQDFNPIRVDQGLDTSEISRDNELDADLVETQYILEIDNRLGFIRTTDLTPARPSFIDDDNIASYYFANLVNPEYVSDNPADAQSPSQVINGPVGTTLKFAIGASLDLRSSTFLFTKLGTTGQDTFGLAEGTYAYLDSNIRVTGLTTGSRLDIPVRFVKKTA